MKHVCTFLIIIIFSFATFTANATDYFFSSTGSDNNIGTSENSPFKSLAKANSLGLFPGDRLLFKRGDVFRGELLIIASGTPSNPITISSYGQGANAVISGSEFVNNWQSVGNGIYRASCPVYPQMVFYNGKAQKLGRYPNAGFLFTDAANGNNGFTDNALPNTGNFYEGSTVHIRTARYRYEERTVAVQANYYLGFSSPTAQNIVAGAGYYLTEKLSFVDAATEYYYDVPSQQLYLKTENELPPSDNTVQASRYDNGIKVESSGNTNINNITINHYQKSGIQIYGAPTSGLTVSNCSFENIFLYAMVGANKSNVTISNNYFSDIHCEALNFGGIVNTTINDNTFKRIGLLAGRATDNRISYTTIAMNTSSGTIRNNILDSIGYNGIQFYQNTIVEKNKISRFCLSMDDGAAINAYGTTNGIRNGTGSVVRYNLLSDAVGNAESYPFRTDPFVGGIGMDDNSGGATIEFNTVYNVSGRGISIHNSSYNQVRNNTLFNCKSSLVFEHDEFGGMLYDNTASENILYNMYQDESALKIQNWNYSEPGLNFGTFTNNYYINPYNEVPIYTAEYGTTDNGGYDLLQNEYTVKGIKNLRDAGAKESPIRMQNYSVTSTVGNNLITNGNFDNNISGWACWAPNLTCTTNWETSALLDAGSIRLSSPSFYYGFFISTIPFALQQNKQYLLTYSVAGSDNRTNAILLQDGNTNALITPRFQKEVATTRLNQKLLLSPNTNTNNGVLTFYVGPEYTPTYSLDNIKLEEVTTATVDPKSQNLFLVNTNNVDQTFPLTGSYLNVDGQPVSGSITLQPFTSKVLMTLPGTGVLPLNFLNISARTINTTTSRVEWEIASATNEGCEMEVQKSADGIGFGTIGNVSYKANLLNYTIEDDKFSNTSFYRIKSYCRGEQPRYSKIVKLVKNQGTDDLIVYPNPITNSTLNINNNSNYTNLVIFGTDGKKLVTVLLKKGNNVITLPATISKGIYIAECIGSKGLSKTFKVIKN
jgi:parallel beta-helix repeat protein